ncbi:ABC-2 type transport system permease protein [Virgibacillus natechei]|uniref:ABC-2 type transport system permease protein n=1 Tax=Virgibacillus natechei TaxID=1216297 RepID=A0ABS4IE34_9BACI|nr:ABC transporter permease [Virgibacillus natechei]MBP1969211.1 ABC-2 type transport system permease protein [Virgibacillus natechei]UZD12375.1 ABC transporter permease [Virgibacillus natechei]
MGSFFKKDLLVFWRDRKEIFASLTLPIALILVLNIAFSGLLDEEAESVDIDVAIVQEDNESIGMEQFEEKVNEMDVPSAEKEALLAQSAQISPAGLINDYVNDPEMREFVSSQQLRNEEATELVEEGKLDAFITIPEGFTYSVLSSMLLGEDPEKSLMINVEEESTEVQVLENMVTNYMDTLNYQFALGSTVEADMAEPELPEGSRENVEGVESYTMPQYFTVAISALFCLFIASTVAMKAITEKREHVFNRILLTNSKPFHYLMGKIASTFFMSWIQLLLTFTITQLIMDVFSGMGFEFWIGTFIVLTVYSIAVSGLAALFIPITLRLEDPNAANGIFMMIIMGMGMLGGSFFPLDFLPEWIQRIGAWTPNGLTQVTLLEWVQFGSFVGLIIPVMLLLGFFIICLIIGMFLFPRRESV